MPTVPMTISSGATPRRRRAASVSADDAGANRSVSTPLGMYCTCEAPQPPGRPGDSFEGARRHDQAGCQLERQAADLHTCEFLTERLIRQEAILDVKGWSKSHQPCSEDRVSATPPVSHEEIGPLRQKKRPEGAQPAEALCAFRRDHRHGRIGEACPPADVAVERDDRVLELRHRVDEDGRSGLPVHRSRMRGRRGPGAGGSRAWMDGRADPRIDEAVAVRLGTPAATSVSCPTAVEAAGPRAVLQLAPAERGVVGLSTDGLYGPSEVLERPPLRRCFAVRRRMSRRDSAASSATYSDAFMVTSPARLKARPSRPLSANAPAIAAATSPARTNGSG